MNRYSVMPAVDAVQVKMTLSPSVGLIGLFKLKVGFAGIISVVGGDCDDLRNMLSSCFKI